MFKKIISFSIFISINEMCINNLVYQELTDVDEDRVPNSIFSKSVCVITYFQMSSAIPTPTRDYSILNPRQLRLLRQRAAPPQRDTTLDQEQEEMRSKHLQTQKLVTGWTNTVARNRLDRQTRLQKEAEAEEKRKQLIDQEEKKIQKLKRQAQIAEAQKAEFSQRPEVRAVNAQLLLHEVQIEREQQELQKERRKILEMKRQIAEDERLEREHAAMVAKEEKIKQERRLKAIETAKEFKKQRELKEELKMRQREEDLEDERLIAEQMAIEAEEEKIAVMQQRQLARDLMKETMSENDKMIKYKERQAQIEEIEEEKIRKMALFNIEEEERRKAIDEKRHRDKLLARQSLIEAERKRQEATKTIQQDFLDKQLAEQHEKELKEVAEITAKQNRLIEERKRDFLETNQLKAIREKEQRERKKNKRPYPFNGDTTAEDQARERDLQKMRNEQELRKFQIQQTKEKKEREEAERERERLEFLYEREKEQQELEEAQEYARAILAQADEDDY